MLHNYDRGTSDVWHLSNGFLEAIIDSISKVHCIIFSLSSLLYSKSFNKCPHCMALISSIVDKRRRV